MNKMSLVSGVFLSSMMFCLCMGSAVYGKEMLTPESFSKRITLQPAITKIIEEDDPAEALRIVNTLHGKMAEQGWELFDMMEFIDDEDFEGFFVTYKKKKE